MIQPFRTLTELAEPVGGLVANPRRMIPAFRGGGSVLDEPRPPMPEGRVVEVSPGIEVFYRDTGAPPLRQRGTVLLLHGWMVPSDPHWFRTWRLLQVDGWRVIAADARGHGHGPRPHDRFRLTDCADDVAALLRTIDAGPVIVVGYSMGGTIAQLLVRDHPELVLGAVFCATGCEFRTSLLMRMVWYGMSAWQFYLRLAPRWTWEATVRLITSGDPQTTAWAVGELRRGAPWDIAEAGREIGRFDSREWIAQTDVPSAVVLPTLDVLVPPARQRELADLLDAPVFEMEADHLAPGTAPHRFHRCLQDALHHVQRERLSAVERRTA